MALSQHLTCSGVQFLVASSAAHSRLKGSRRSTHMSIIPNVQKSTQPTVAHTAREAVPGQSHPMPLLPVQMRSPAGHNAVSAATDALQQT
eukprot:1978550-Rhodomonas_salina.1